MDKHSVSQLTQELCLPIPKRFETRPVWLEAPTDTVMQPVVSGTFLPVIQLAITPVILLSGVGALLITLTNRMGRVVDRTRSLAGQIRQQPGGDERAHLERQLAIMWRRAKLVRIAVTFAAASMLLSCVLVMGIFADILAEVDFGRELVAVFVVSVLSLIAALLAFLRDIWMSLWALNLEVTAAVSSAEQKRNT